MILEEFIHPMSLEDFFQTVWTRKTKIFPGNPEQFDRFITLESFCRHALEMKSASAKRTKIRPSIEPVRDSVSPTWPISQASSDTSNLITLQDSVPAEGTSLRFNRIDMKVPELAPLVNQFFHDFEERISLNSYFSPPSSNPGLTWHADPEDIFIMQIAGTKSWEIAQRSYPKKQDQNKAILQLTNESISPLKFNVAPGNLLYIPGDTPHRAYSKDEISLHVTIGIHRKSGINVIEWLSEELSNHAAFTERFSNSKLGAPQNQPKPAQESFNDVTALIKNMLDDPNAYRRFQMARLQYETSVTFPANHES